MISAVKKILLLLLPLFIFSCGMTVEESSFTAKLDTVDQLIFQSQFNDAQKILKSMNCPFIINQNSYSIFNRTIEKNGILKASIEEKKGMIIFSPLAQGLLSNRYINGIPLDSRIKTDGRFLNEHSLSAEKLEKIKKLTGLDLREFDHAVTFKVALMVKKYLTSKPVKF